MNAWNRLRRILRLEHDLDDELRAHLAMAIRERIERGQSPAEAEREARLEFGNELLIREVTRDAWGWTALEELKRNLRYAAAQIRRTPAFSLVAFLCLSLGLGATVTMFSIVNGVLLKPLSFHDPGRLYLARTVLPPDADVAGDFPVNARYFHQWRTECKSCESLALVQFQDLTLLGEGEPVKLPALAVSADVFRTLGVQPALGRDFLPDEEGPGRADIVILSDALWRSRFHADPNITGRKIWLNGEQHRVAGVMPPELHLPKGDEWGSFFGPAATPLIFRPLMIDAARQRPAGNLNYSAVIRLKAGVARSAAADELNALTADFVRESKQGTRTILVPFERQVTGGYAFALWFLLAMVAALLLIVCVNLGNLMLVRTASRYREAGIRMALGASSGQLLRLALTEAALLVALGTLGALALAQAGLRLFMALAPLRLPRLEEVQVDWRVLLFSAGAAGFCTLICGLFPAWRLSRIDPQESLKSGASRATEAGGKLRAREVMVGLEVALTTVLLVLGALLLASFLRVLSVDRGFESARIVTQHVSYLSPKYARGVRRQRIQETVEALARIPGVETAAAINQLPLRGEDWTSDLEDPERRDGPSKKQALANFRFVSPGYWQAMSIPLRRGRLLNEADQNQPRAVISERAAEYLWPGQDPLGRKVRGVGSESPALEVVGVVGEVRAKGLEQNPPMIVYEHFWRVQPLSMTYLARTRGAPPSEVARQIRSTLVALDPEMAIDRSWTMQEIVDESVAIRRFQLYLALAFAGCALAVAALGVYGAISWTVAKQTPEIGIRAALGAGRWRLTGAFLARGMRPVALGMMLGLAGAAIASRAIASQLFQMTPWDPAAFAAVAALLLSVGLLACWFPACRAARLDPAEALRFE